MAAIPVAHRRLDLRAHRAALAVTLAVLLVAFGLRVWDLGSASVWHDEAWSIRAIRDPINTPDDNTPPVYYSLVHLLYLGAGDSALALRYGSLLIDLLTVALAIRLARGWASWDAAILAGVLFALSPLLWAYAREIRAYALVPLLTLLLLALAERLLTRRERFPWRLTLVTLTAEIALLYTHNLSVPVVAWLNIVITGAWTLARCWRWLAIWLAGQALALLAYIPWLLGQSPSGTPLNTPPALSPNLLWDIWRAYFAPVPALIGAELGLNIASAIFGLVAVLATAALLIRCRTRAALLLLSQAALLPALATVELRVAQIDFHPRYYIAGVPATLLLVALGLDCLPDDLGLRRGALAGGVALASLTAASSLIPALSHPRYQHDDFRAIARYYADLPPDALILIPYGWEPALEEYYVDKLDVQAQLVGVPLHSAPGDAIERVNAALAERTAPARVELLTWYQLPADERGMFPCLLSAAGRPTGETVTVQGLTTTAYQVERPLALAPLDNTAADFGAIRLESAAIGGDNALCVQTAWTLTAPSDADWRVAARLLTVDPPGWTLARSDSDIRLDDQAPTSGWDAGERGAAFSLLSLPAGTPPGEYTVTLAVYSEAAPDGLDRLIDGVPSGRALTLVTLQSAGTTDEIPSTPGRAEDVRLIGSDAADGSLSPGQALRVTLRWLAPESCCAAGPWSAASLILRSDGWQQSQPVRVYSGYSLDWHPFSIPADASRQAELWLDFTGAGAQRLATYTIEDTDRLFAPPPFAQAVGAQFKGVATLEGYTLERATVGAGDPLALTLVWRAAATPPVAYTVFAHLLDADGRFIGGHDSPPGEGNRPTTGWVAGEYIVDVHALAPEDAAYRG
ncbi:MAG: hypothetical protein IT325_03060, partial [Anaerolineae bacterium]|nr:hypothetical protein [Anaerolineae bacterium]